MALRRLCKAKSYTPTVICIGLTPDQIGRDQAVRKFDRAVVLDSKLFSEIANRRTLSRKSLDRQQSLMLP